jgi:hypothetical protein
MEVEDMSITAVISNISAFNNYRSPQPTENRPQNAQAKPSFNYRANPATQAAVSLHISEGRRVQNYGCVDTMTQRLRKLLVQGSSVTNAEDGKSNPAFNEINQLLIEMGRVWNSTPSEPIAESAFEQMFGQIPQPMVKNSDAAKTAMAQIKENMLQQAKTAMLAQANQSPQNVLHLLQ